MNKRLSKDEFPTDQDKSCPFCASRNLFCEQTEIGEGWIVWCGNCGCFGPNDLGWSGAIEMWNLRRPTDALVNGARLATVELDLIDTQGFDEDRYRERIQALGTLHQALRSFPA